MNTSAAILLALAGLAGVASAQDTLGPAYPIREPDMLEEIYGKLRSLEKSGRLKELQQEGAARVRRSVESPKAVDGLTKTDKPRTFYMDPSWRVPRDIVTPEGQIIARAGDVVNPLDYVQMSNHLLFFDQRDPSQVVKAAAIIKRYDGKVKPILVAGEPLKLTRQWKRQVYFDQGGYLVKRFGIQQIPALVSQDVARKQLRIDEIKAD